MDVAGWLHSLGLGPYEAAFAGNNMDFHSSAEVDGRRPEGPWRRRHRRSAQRFRRHWGNWTLYRTPPGSDGQNRYPPWMLPNGATVCDVLRSRWLEQPCQPSSIPRICVASSAPIIAAARNGSNATAVWLPNIWATACWLISGIPEAHEHDAERAVQAELAMVDAVPARHRGRVAPAGAGRPCDRPGHRR